ncbi:hypothetical protein FB45DRAFT_1027364 [Roridomyces roridus]|uniref:Uncharacterized protein n=1 Tax=Roridomyces roridus TaxID=1738132 RepID=A0AAD7BZ82_9AGAR|nr:hypothetical protein FB45DRAFT_1027364 [Roridomyces roridus]
MSSPVPVPPTIQLASSDPHAWEEQWHRYFILLHAKAPNVSLEAVNVRDLVEQARTQWSPKDRDRLIRYIRGLRECLLYIQVEMTREAAHVLGQGLQQGWISTTPERRGEAVLSALVHSCQGLSDKGRFFCEKELDVESHRRDGQLFLALLQDMMVQNQTTTAPNAPTYISHPAWDALANEVQPSPDQKLALATILAERNALLGEILTVPFFTLFNPSRFAGLFAWSTLRSLLDLPMPETTQSKGPNKPVNRKSTATHPVQSSAGALYGEQAANQIRKAMRENEKALHMQLKEAHAYAAHFVK